VTNRAVRDDLDVAKLFFERQSLRRAFERLDQTQMCPLQQGSAGTTHAFPTVKIIPRRRNASKNGRSPRV
jgi:hypothetical protein